MLIGFLGDVHGRVFHALAALATWQQKLNRQFDLLIQVGDMGAFPDPSRMDTASRIYAALDPADADFSHLLLATGKRAEHLWRLRAYLGSPVLFVRGNHEDFDWLRDLTVDPTAGTALVDPFDCFRYVPDGAVLDRYARMGGLRVAFLGGVEEQAGAAGIDAAAFTALLQLEPGTVVLLISHEGPYGSSTGYYGDVHGSQQITRLLERLRPPFHVAGHAHQLIGPRRFGVTTYLGLDGLVASARWQPEARGLQPGCLGVLDTETQELTAVTDAWLAEFPTPFDFDAWAAAAL